MKFLLIKAGDQKNIDKFIMNAPSIGPTLGLLYLGAVLEQEGHKVEILDYYMENISREQLEKSLMSSDAVGMTIYTYDYIAAANISKMIKEIHADIPLIIGGPHCTFFQKRALQDIPFADISIVGEGEQTILELAQGMNNLENLREIAGISFKKKGQVIRTADRAFIQELDALPYPALKYFPLENSLLAPVLNISSTIASTFSLPTKAPRE
jgi:radical SAM superfamily enzyme YgiQ (UPF0313 family)